MNQNQLPPRILVVDDNPDIHSDFRKVLAGDDPLRTELKAATSALFNRQAATASPGVRFEVDAASQGQEGLELAKRALAEGRPYEAAFVDMRMPPGWDGLETILHLWQVQPALQVIICTAYSDHSWEEINRRLSQSDRFLILKKPFDNVEVRQLACALASRARLEREVAETNRRMIEASRLAGMAEVATGVLHNVGNVLNSVNVAATLVHDRLRQSKAPTLAKAVQLLEDHKQDLAAFLTTDDKGRQLPAFLKALSDHLQSEQAELLRELAVLTTNVGHIKEIIAMQQNYAKVSGVIERLSPAQLAVDALNIRSASFVRHGIRIVRDFAEAPQIAVDRHKVLQILINLLSNAKHAVCNNDQPEKRITVRVRHQPGGPVTIAVEDNGQGISAEDQRKIFQYGFTTKKDGHGFGLHSGANAAKEMGGSLSAASEGPGRGATFTLELPVPNADAPARAA